ncbi:unnamed protein product [Phaedon cochleariae]|uniref:Chitin-binding type-2 domain-containing protein n=1 Tax=Phaedon cochleariae TaxID=80249 RepID=A0A9P0GQR5_PHACE|nr:unnamed protein product [Phaedon cochleariae]
MVTMMSEKPEISNNTLTPAEREKRLLPYETFYQNQPFNRPRFQRPFEKYNDYVPKPIYNQQAPYPQTRDALYQTQSKFTPFLESNALPGAFRPMVHLPQRAPSVKVRYVSVPQNKVPNFSSIYDNLAQLKLEQNSRRPSLAPPQRYVFKPQVDYSGYKVIQPTKTTIETFTATSIDIPSGPSNVPFRPIENYRETKPFIDQQVVLGEPQYPVKDYITRKPYQQNSFIIVPAPDSRDTRKPLIVIQRKPIFKGKHVDDYEAPKYIQISEETPNKDSYDYNNYETPTVYQDSPKYEEIQKVPEPEYEEPTSYQVTTRYEELQEISTPKYEPQHVQYHQQTHQKNSVPLADILKHLQATNTLPKTLTPDNIDNSIKTLVRILDALKKRQQISKPIVVEDEPSVSSVSSDYEEDIDNEAGVGISGYPGELPGTQSFPLDTDEGGTPGKPGVDYPALSTIPQTNFNCKTQRYKGFFGDPDTNCQVWHYCDLNGGQASFLCPNGTIFSQVALTCDWWYNVKCATTSQLYVLNERLYKYIIPLSPKFPEDYSGPLVDKYLALKFQEMEDKMRKEKKGKGNSIKMDDSVDIDDVSSDETEKVTTLESSTASSKKETLQTIEDHISNK